MVVVDQPLDAIAKKMRWTFPEIFRKGEFVLMLRRFHIETALWATVADRSQLRGHRSEEGDVETETDESAFDTTIVSESSDISSMATQQQQVYDYGPPAKRSRADDVDERRVRFFGLTTLRGGIIGRRRGCAPDAVPSDSYEDPRKPSSSPVVHVRGLSEIAVESDLTEALQHFGPIGYVVIMHKRRQALVEFEDLESARSCVTYTVSNPMYVCGQQAYFNYSTSQKISRPGGSDDGRSATNHILLFTILNPAYPITTDVIYTICYPCGTVQRIVIFKKNGLQAMIEYPYCQQHLFS
uniref:heterogeneous nuclear ribonucleoprotein L-like n=1 Tax=Myxine glutinosa TaxID=7769 RepID=UPI00358EE8AE